MRSLIALFVGLALLFGGPATASAATACELHPTPAVATMTMSGMAHTARDKMHKSCAQACAMACCIGGALPGAWAGSRIFTRRAATTPDPVVALRSYDPSGLDPPPKSIA